MSRSLAAFRELDGYFEALAAHYQEEPRENLLCNLLEVEEAGDRLGAEELRGLCAELMTAGHETTMGLLASGVWLLDRYPEERHALLEEPKLIPAAVEEILRFESPVRLLVRTATQATSLGEQTIAHGDRVMLLLAGANRDPLHFERPEIFDVRRDPNPHLAFGLGTHFCVRSQLARVETRIALSRLLARFPAFRVTTREPA